MDRMLGTPFHPDAASGLLDPGQERFDPRDERGLSQSTENAILLAGAALIAGIIIKVITDYVSDKLPT